MPTPSRGPRLGGSPNHERLILSNLATQLFEHGRITTTVPKAKRLRPLAERLITKARRGDLHARRQVSRVVRDAEVARVLFSEIGPRYANRPGGYTRITKIGPRKGDSAPLAVIELVEELAERPTRPAAKKTARKAAKKAAKQAESEEPQVEQAEAEEPEAAEAGAEEAGAEEPQVELEPGGPYGPASAEPLDDGSAPEGYPVKGNAGSKKYHTPESPWYDRTTAEVWFTSAEEAEKAGFSAPGKDASADDAEEENES